MKPLHEPSWNALLASEFKADYFSTLQQFLQDERSKHIVYPCTNDVFNAFDLTPVDKVKVVILGQDPYHGAGQAHGLSFSVPEGIKIPPSLRNIFKELHSDLGITAATSGNLGMWAKQGVLLLNATLTVQQGKAGSHQKKGWEQLTNAVIKKLAAQRQNLVFLLWGKYAQSKITLINKENNHLILQAPHPSPFSAHKGFFGCQHFSKTNAFLKQNKIVPIQWDLNTQLSVNFTF